MSHCINQEREENVIGLMQNVRTQRKRETEHGQDGKEIRTREIKMNLRQQEINM